MMEARRTGLARLATGAAPHAERSEIVRIAAINAVALLGIVICVVSLVLRSWTVDAFTFIRIAATAAWLVLVLGLHARGRAEVAALFFSLTAPLSIAPALVLHGPTDAGDGTHLYLLVGTLLPFVALPAHQTRQAALASAAAALFFVVSVLSYTDFETFVATLGMTGPQAMVNHVGSAAMILALGYTARAQVLAVENGLREEQRRSLALLEATMPAAIIARLQRGETRIAERHSDVSVLFCRLVDYVERTRGLTAQLQLRLLDEFVTLLDDACQRHGVERLKAWGPQCMIASGLSTGRHDHAEVLVAFAVDLMRGVSDMRARTGLPLDLRIGINSGPVVAGVIGRSRLSYDLWGDTVNTAQRMEVHGLAGEIQLSPLTYSKVNHRYRCDMREMLEIKGKLATRAFLIRGPIGAEEPS